MLTVIQFGLLQRFSPCQVTTTAAAAGPDTHLNIVCFNSLAVGKLIVCGCFKYFLSFYVVCEYILFIVRAIIGIRSVVLCFCFSNLFFAAIWF
jgi:hypothetical protein